MRARRTQLRERRADARGVEHGPGIGGRGGEALDGAGAARRCRAHALAAREPYGVWGGLSEHDREAILGQSLAATG